MTSREQFVFGTLVNVIVVVVTAAINAANVIVTILFFSCFFHIYVRILDYYRCYDTNI
jgi:hypothetical protein